MANTRKVKRLIKGQQKHMRIATQSYCHLENRHYPNKPVSQVQIRLSCISPVIYCFFFIIGQVPPQYSAATGLALQKKLQ